MEVRVLPGVPKEKIPLKGGIDTIEAGGRHEMSEVWEKDDAGGSTL